MDAFHTLASGLWLVVAPLDLLAMVAGLFVGVVAGAVPGISFVNAMAISLPFTYLMSPIVSMMYLTGLYVGGVFGGSISSILVNIPGDPDSVPSCWDGYPLGRRDGPVRALSIAITASALGGLASALLLAFAAPPFARVALMFDQPEFFAATAMGLASVLAMCRGQSVAGLLSLFAGLVLGSVGSDPLFGVQRLTFGTSLLENGIDFVVVLIGVFAIAEMIENFAQRGAGMAPHAGPARMGLLSVRDAWALRRPLARGTLVGSLIGLVPGAGAAVGAFVAYGIERQVNRRGAWFGTGEADGLVAPEASKNATTGTAMIPLLTLGIPGSSGAAIMLASLTLHDVQVGPQLFTRQPELVQAILGGFLVANLLMVVVSMAVARGFGRLMRMNPAILHAFILVLCLVGAFAVRNNVADVFVAIAFGVFGYLLKCWGIPSAPLVLGVVLGPLAEGYFMTSVATYGSPAIFLQRPVSATLLFAALLFVAWSLLPRGRRREEGGHASAPSHAPDPA